MTNLIIITSACVGLILGYLAGKWTEREYVERCCNQRRPVRSSRGEFFVMRMADFVRMQERQGKEIGRHG